MNVVIWARVSSREQKEGYSIDAQLRATRDRALKNGWTVVREFAVAESAKRGAERAVFNEMFKWVNKYHPELRSSRKWHADGRAKKGKMSGIIVR